MCVVEISADHTNVYANNFEKVPWLTINKILSKKNVDWENLELLETK